MMKALGGILLAAVLLLTSVAPGLAAEQKIADVPPAHWAYQAVSKLVAQGYLGLYPDKTFRGDQPVDRFTLAVVVAKMLGDAVAGKTAPTGEDADLLRRLTNEFRQELVTLAGRSKNLEEALAKYERDRETLGADMAAWREETGQARTQLAAALAEIVQLQQRLGKLEDTVAAVDAQAKARDDANAQADQENAKKTEDLQQQVSGLQERTAKLEKNVKMWQYISAGLAVLIGVFI